MKVNQIKMGAILSYVTIFVSNVVALVYTPIMLRLMGQSEYGLYSLISTVIGYLTILDLGFGNAIVVYTSKYIAKGKDKEKSKLNGMFIVIYTIIGIIAAVIGVVLYLNVNTLFGTTMTPFELEKTKIMMLILTFNLAISFPLGIFGSILTAHQEFIFPKIINILRSILLPCIMLPLLFMGYRSITMVIVVSILNILMLLVNMAYAFGKLKIKIGFGKFDFSLLKEIFGYSFFIFLNVLIDKVNWSVDQFILGSIVGTVAVSIYAVATQFNNIYLAFSTAISGVMLPKISGMIALEKTKKEISDLFIRVGRIQYLILSFIITGFMIYGKQFIIFWAGPEYVSSYYIACILMVPVTIPIIQNIGISIQQAMNKHKFRSIVYFVIAIVNVIISIPLAKMYGGIGSAIGTAISLIAGNIIIMNIYYHKVIKLNIIEFFKQILKITSFGLVAMLIGYLIKYLIPIDTISNLVINIGVYSVIYLSILWFFATNEYEKQLIKSPINKIKNKFRRSHI